MNAFVASPGHYKTLTDPRFTLIGVGTVHGPDGMLYTAHEFMTLSGSPAPRPTPTVTVPPVTTPTTARVAVAAKPVAVVTTTTTAPPPTTTLDTTPPPTTTTTLDLAGQQNELQHGRADNQQQKANKSPGNCGSHRRTTLQVSVLGDGAKGDAVTGTQLQRIGR